MIELRRITEKSMSKILALNVSENQKHYIDTGGNRDALAFCYAWTVEGKDVHAHAVYAEDEVIGLMIYGIYIQFNTKIHLHCVSKCVIIMV